MLFGETCIFSSQIRSLGDLIGLNFKYCFGSSSTKGFTVILLLPRTITQFVLGLGDRRLQPPTATSDALLQPRVRGNATKEQRTLCCVLGEPFSDVRSDRC